MARVWQSGFELNSTTTDMEFSTTSGTASVQTTTVRTGTYAGRTNPTATTGFFRQHLFTANQSTAGYQRAYFRVAALPAANTTIMRFVDVSNNPCAQVRITAAGTLVLLDAASNPIGSASATLSLDTWYRLELAVDASTSPGTVEARLDGTSFASGANSLQSPWARILIGPVVSATTDIYWDDWAVNDSTGTAQTSWPGSGKILHLLPNGDGDTHGWSNTSNGAGSSSNYTLVNQAPPDDATTLVQTGTLNTEDSYALTDSGIGSGDTVNAVMVGVRLRNNTADATAAVKAQIKKTSGGTVAQGSAIIPNTTTWVTNAPTQPRNYTLVTYADPDGNPWTQATLDTAQASIKLTAAGTNRVQVTALWVSVDYTPSSSTPVSSSDSAGATDTSALSATGSAADTGGAAEGSALTAGLAASDTAGTVENATVSLSSADSAAAVDAATVVAALTAAETAGSADAGATSAAYAAADTGGATEATVLASVVTAGDTASAADDPSLTVDATAVDTAAGADNIGPTSAAVSAADAVLAADSGSLDTAATAADIAAADDTAEQTVDLDAADAAAADDAETVEQSLDLTDDDSATAAENVHVDFGDGSTAVSDSDQCAAAEAAVLEVDVAATDTSAVADEVVDAARSLTDADAASVVDAATLITFLAAAETAAGNDTDALTAAAVDADTATTMDGAVATIALVASDTATATETATTHVVQDVTITVGALARGWSVGWPARGWSVGGLST